MNGAKEFAYRLRCDSALAPDTATSLLLEKAAEMIFALQAEIDSANEVTDEMARAALQEWLGISYDKNPDEYAHDLCEAKQAIKAALEVRSK